jgi:hypothetical protein
MNESYFLGEFSPSEPSAHRVSFLAALAILLALGVATHIGAGSVAGNSTRIAGAAVTQGGGYALNGGGVRLAARVMNPAFGQTESPNGTRVNGAVIFYGSPRAGAANWSEYR